MKGSKACLVAWWMVGDRTRFWAVLSPWALGENRAARKHNPSFSCTPDPSPYMYLIPPKNSRAMGFTPFIP
jgi:hypothetical protein